LIALAPSRSAVRPANPAKFLACSVSGGKLAGASGAQGCRSTFGALNFAITKVRSLPYTTCSMRQLLVPSRPDSVAGCHPLTTLSGFPTLLRLGRAHSVGAATSGHGQYSSQPAMKFPAATWQVASLLQGSTLEVRRFPHFPFCPDWNLFRISDFQ
jgi:hypothetical protein